MTAERIETVNPHIKTKTFFYTDVVNMDELHFHTKPDQTLKGTRYLKRQMIPNLEEEDATSDEVEFPPNSFLWKSNLQESSDFEGHFDSKQFMQAHRHLLPNDDHSLELEKNLKNRRRHIGTMSTVDSRMDRGFTSTDEINRFELQSPYDELTYEETLFEVLDDRIRAKSVSSQDEDEILFNSVNKSKVSTVNTRMSQKIIGGFQNKFLSVKSSDKKNGEVERFKSSSEQHSRRMHNNVSGKHKAIASKEQGNSSDKTVNQADLIPKDLLDEYIEERIRAVEMQIRNEIMRDQLSEKKYDRKNEEKSLLDKVPEVYSIELEQADESSRDSLLKEIAAVLVSKGYVANVDTNENKREQSTESKSKTFGAFDRIRRTDRKTSNEKLPKRTQKKTSYRSTTSTYKSHYDSSRHPTSLGSEKSFSLQNSSQVRGVHEKKRRKLRSSGSRSSLTSLIRTPEYTSSSDDHTVLRNKSRRSLGSSKRSSVVSSKHVSLEKRQKRNELYDNVVFKNNKSNGKQLASKSSESGSTSKRTEPHTDHSRANKDNASLKSDGNLSVNSASENHDQNVNEGDLSTNNENCTTFTEAQTDAAKEGTISDSNKAETNDIPARPTPPPRRKYKASGATPQPKMITHTIPGFKIQDGAIQKEYTAGSYVARRILQGSANGQMKGMPKIIPYVFSASFSSGRNL